MNNEWRCEYCNNDLTWHIREWTFIYENEGPEAAAYFEYEHQKNEEDYDE